MGDLIVISGDFENNDPEWVTIDIGDSGENLVLVELTHDEQIIAMSNKRNVYRSLDQSVTFEFEGQINYLEYWGKLIKLQWQHWSTWFVVKIKLYWLKRFA